MAVPGLQGKFEQGADLASLLIQKLGGVIEAIDGLEWPDYSEAAEDYFIIRSEAVVGAGAAPSPTMRIPIPAGQSWRLEQLVVFLSKQDNSNTNVDIYQGSPTDGLPIGSAGIHNPFGPGKIYRMEQGGPIYVTDSLSAVVAVLDVSATAYMVAMGRRIVTPETS